jgi:hypothetical protein
MSTPSHIPLAPQAPTTIVHPAAMTTPYPQPAPYMNGPQMPPAAAAIPVHKNTPEQDYRNALLLPWLILSVIFIIFWMYITSNWSLTSVFQNTDFLLYGLFMCGVVAPALTYAYVGDMTTHSHHKFTQWVEDYDRQHGNV